MSRKESQTTMQVIPHLRCPHKSQPLAFNLRPRHPAQLAKHRNVPQLAHDVPHLTRSVPQLACNVPQPTHNVPQVARNIPQLARNVPQPAMFLSLLRPHLLGCGLPRHAPHQGAAPL